MNKRDVRIGLIVVLLWGFNFVTIKLGVKGVPPLLLASIRLILVSFPIIFFLPRPPIAWKWLIAIAMTLNAGQFAFLFIGMKLGMTAGLASFVLQAQAFFTLALSVLFLKEHWHWNHLVGLVFAAAGIVVIGLQQINGVTLAGIVLTVAAAFWWGIGNVIIRHTSKGVSSLSNISLTVWIGALAILPLLVLSYFIEGTASWLKAFHSISWTTAISVIYLSYIGTLIGYSLWGKLLSRNPAIMVAPFSLLVPIVAMVGSTIILRENISAWQIGGGLLIMSGLVLNVFGGRLIKPGYEPNKKISEY
jgi:O-acetylserine/cysteine efflux transporter